MKPPSLRHLFLSACLTLHAPLALAQTDLSPFGCLNPAGSLVRSSGSGSLGGTLVLGVDNPLGVQAPGSQAFLLAAIAPDPGHPCGTALPGYGLAGPAFSGELLLSLSPPNPLLVLGPAAWSGTGSPALFPLPFPDDLSLADVHVYFQGGLVAPAGTIGLTEALDVVVGRCPGLTGISSSYDVGKEPQEIVAGDFDEDGALDLVVINQNGDDLSILLGHGDGTFAVPVEYPTGFFPFSVTAADFDGDGHLDVAVANDGTFEVDLLFGGGDGTFSAPASFVVADFPRSIEAGDLDADGDVDLALVHELDDLASVLLNDGSGGFGPPTTYPTGEEPLGLTIADVNLDGTLDLAVANNDTDDVTLLLGTGTGSFVAGPVLSAGERPRGVAVADLNGDGWADLVAANFGSDDLSILLGTGPGTFGPPVLHPTPDSPNDIEVVDVNQDGHLDLVVAHDSNSDLLTVSFGRGNGSFSAAQSLPTGAVAPTAVAADLDGNGTVDIAVPVHIQNDVLVFLNGCD